MKLDPGFTTHWKTERLIEELGSCGLVALIRLWSKAQIRREWKGLIFTPKRLAMETKWKGDENHLFQVFTDPDAPWLDMAEDGSFEIHGFEEHQKQVIHLWNAGVKGGRPPKADPAPLNKEEDISSSTSSSSSSYPRCEANGNHMVFVATKVELPFPSEAFAKAWLTWEKHRREIKKKLTEESVRQQFKKFAEWGEAKSIESILYTVEKGWQGLVEAPSATAPVKPHRQTGYQENLELP